MRQVVVVGGGHAAAQFVASMVDKQQGGRVLMVTEENHLPYHKPPLSKNWGQAESIEPALIRTQAFYQDNGVEVICSTRAVAIDVKNRTVELDSGDLIKYTDLVLATGLKPRGLPVFETQWFDNVHHLRSLNDAMRLAEQVKKATKVLIVGGGFIGLEVASICAELGKSVTVIEASDRLLSRSVSPEVADYLLAHHKEAGVQFFLSTTVSDVIVSSNKVVAVKMHDQKELDADLILVAIGGVPNDELARAAGLECDDGILVNELLETNQSGIYAIGDCARFPSVHMDESIRLESVQNAHDQARLLAANFLGDKQSYQALPWFWSEQGRARLQIAGLPRPSDQRVLRGSPTDNKFSVLYFDGNYLKAIESINFPADHMVAKQLISNQTAIERNAVKDGSLALKDVQTLATSIRG